MNQLSRMLRNELLYVYYSKALVVLVGVLIVIVSLTLWSTASRVQGAYRDYQRTRAEASQAGQNPDKMLLQPLNVKTSNSGDAQLTEVDNPVRYSFESVVNAVDAVSLSVLISAGLAATAFLIGPLAFAAWGVFFATYDYTSKTVKVKAASGDWTTWVVAKGFAVVVTVFAAIVILLLALVVGAQGLHMYALSHLPDAAQFTHAAPRAISLGALGIQALVAAVVGIFFASIGFAGGMVFRRVWPPLLAIAAYNLFVPTLGKYDVKNIVSVVGHSVFDFRGAFQLFTPIPFNVTAAYALLLIGSVVLFGIGIAASDAQSRYAV